MASLTDEPEDYLKAAAAWSIGQARQMSSYTETLIPMSSLACIRNEGAILSCTFIPLGE